MFMESRQKHEAERVDARSDEGHAEVCSFRPEESTLHRGSPVHERKGNEPDGYHRSEDEEHPANERSSLPGLDEDSEEKDGCACDERGEDV